MTLGDVIYLDYNATAPTHKEIEKEIKKSIAYFGNPSSIHYLGRQSKERNQGDN